MVDCQKKYGQLQRKKSKRRSSRQKRKSEEDDDIFRDDDSAEKYSNMMKTTKSNGDFCEAFLKSTIFDSFEERLLTASVFNYNVNVGVLSDLQGSLDLKYDVSFEPAASAGLDQIEDVDAIPDEPVPISDICEESQCITQRSVMRNIFNHFGMNFDESKHECLYQGINCNMENMVTNIWLSKLIIWLYMMIPIRYINI